VKQQPPTEEMMCGRDDLKVPAIPTNNECTNELNEPTASPKVQAVILPKVSYVNLLISYYILTICCCFSCKNISDIFLFEYFFIFLMTFFVRGFLLFLFFITFPGVFRV